MLAVGMTATAQIDSAAARSQMNIPADGSSFLTLKLQLRSFVGHLALFRDENLTRVKPVGRRTLETDRVQPKFSQSLD